MSSAFKTSAPPLTFPAVRTKPPAPCWKRLRGCGGCFCAANAERWIPRGGWRTRYPEIIEAKRAKEARIELEEQRRREEEDRMLREIEDELNVSLEELEMEDFDERNIA